MNPETTELTAEDAQKLFVIREAMRQLRPLIDALVDPVYYGDWVRVIDLLDALLEPWDRTVRTDDARMRQESEQEGKR